MKRVALLMTAFAMAVVMSGCCCFGGSGEECSKVQCRSNCRMDYGCHVNCKVAPGPAFCSEIELFTE